MALDCLGWAHVTFGTQEFEWEFIVADIGADEGILGNNFAMRHAIMVPPHGVVYLPDAERQEQEVLGHQLEHLV